MADIMIDNWTLQRAAISINDTYEKISSPNEEYVKLIEALVLWDHVYFIDNEYSQYWKKFLYRFGYEKYLSPFAIPNSLNSMAQKFPLVIAPLEHRVCMEVCEYLNSLSDSDIQQQKPRALRISNEVLFSSETYRCQVQSETSAESAAERYLRQW